LANCPREIFAPPKNRSGFFNAWGARCHFFAFSPILNRPADALARKSPALFLNLLKLDLHPAWSFNVRDVSPSAYFAAGISQRIGARSEGRSPAPLIFVVQKMNRPFIHAGSYLCRSAPARPADHNIRTAMAERTSSVVASMARNIQIQLGGRGIIFFRRLAALAALATASCPRVEDVPLWAIWLQAPSQRR
jgi:hypothetical protein